MVEREMGRTEHRNWLQRHLIQRELARGREAHMVEGEQKPDDPLAPVKNYYYQMYTEAIGQPGVTQDSSQVHADAASMISLLVEAAVKNAELLHDNSKEMIEMVPPHLRDDAEQYLIRSLSATTRGTETLIELTIKSYAEKDPLDRSMVGRFIRKFIPSPSDIALKEAVRSHEREIDELVRDFVRYIAGKYRR